MAVQVIFYEKIYFKAIQQINCSIIIWELL